MRSEELNKERRFAALFNWMRLFYSCSVFFKVFNQFLISAFVGVIYYRISVIFFPAVFRVFWARPFAFSLPLIFSNSFPSHCAPVLAQALPLFCEGYPEGISEQDPQSICHQPLSLAVQRYHWPRHLAMGCYHHRASCQGPGFRREVPWGIFQSQPLYT